MTRDFSVVGIDWIKLSRVPGFQKRLEERGTIAPHFWRCPYHSYAFGVEKFGQVIIVALG